MLLSESVVIPKGFFYFILITITGFMFYFDRDRWEILLITDIIYFLMDVLRMFDRDFYFVTRNFQLNIYLMGFGLFLFATIIEFSCEKKWVGEMSEIAKFLIFVDILQTGIFLFCYT